MDQANELRKMLGEEAHKIHRRRGDLDPPFHSGNNGPRVMAVTSGKGGVGKTNIVGNLAIACQRMGKKVLLLDADLGLANIDIIFGLNPEHSIDEVIRGEKELSQIIIEGPEGVAVIPASSGVHQLAHLSEGQKMNLLNEFDLLTGRFDLLLIDTGAGISSNVLYFNLAAEEKIVVVTPEPTSITDAYALMKVMFRQYGTKDFLILMNMVRNEQEAKGVFHNLSSAMGRFMAGISMDYAGCILKDRCLQKAIWNRVPVLCRYPEASSSSHLNELARYLLRRTERAPTDGNIKFFWKRILSSAVE